MRILSALAAVSLLSLAACTSNSGGGSTASASQAIASAIADPARSADQRADDAGRKPAETLAFLGLKPGMDAADVFTGGGYWAQIMARAVAPKGSVVAFEPAQFYNGKGKEALDALAAASPATTVEAFPFESFATAANRFDFAIINLNYHDVYWASERFKIGKQDPDAFVRNLYAAMRPGGIVGIIDHTGKPGDTRETVEKLHRIDPAVVKADFARAGFKLAGESDILRNPADDLTVNVFDKSIRGKTDRFLLKFVKPRT